MEVDKAADSQVLNHASEQLARQAVSWEAAIHEFADLLLVQRLRTPADRCATLQHVSTLSGSFQ